MTSGRNRKTLLAVIGLCAILWLAWYLLSFKSLVVTYKNVSKVEVYKTSSLDAGKGKKPFATLTHSGQKIKLRGGNYTLHYTGNPGYVSRYSAVEVTEKAQAYSINPGYSSERLDEIRKDEEAAIIKAMVAKYPEINTLYKIQPGKLYENGNWYGTTLYYKGTDKYNNDTLRIVLQKVSGAWIVKTVPGIILSTYTYPDVPENVLKDVNALPGAITGKYSL
jgi:hypothetical protein